METVTTFRGERRDVEQGSADGPRVERSPRWEPFLFAALVVGQALPLLAFRYFPGIDTPAHIATTRILNDPAPTFGRYFVTDWFPSPNVLATIVLTALARVTDPLTADRVLVAAIAVALPCSVRYVVTGIDRSRGWLALLAVPLGLGTVVHSGLYSFCIGVALFGLAVGWSLRHERASWRGTLVLGVLLTLTYLAHVVPFVMGLLFLGLRGVWKTVLAPRPDRRAAYRAALRLVAIALPGFALLVAYVVTRGDAGGTARLPFGQLVRGLLSLHLLFATFRRTEEVVGLALALTLAALTVAALASDRRTRRLRSPANAFLGAALVCLAGYLLLPDEIATGGGLSVRLLLFAYVAGLAWLAFLNLPRWAMPLVTVVAVAAVGVLWTIRAPVYGDFERDIREYTSIAPALRPGGTVVPVSYVAGDEPQGSLAWGVYIFPEEELSGYLMSERGVVDLSHYEAAYSYFQVHFRSATDPVRCLAHGDPNWVLHYPPRIDLAGYAGCTHGRGRIDYVVLWGREIAHRDVRDSKAAKRIETVLARDYVLVTRSRDRGYAEVYRHR